jgi:hypothetical protein
LPHPIPSGYIAAGFPYSVGICGTRRGLNLPSIV